MKTDTPTTRPLPPSLWTSAGVMIGLTVASWIYALVSHLRSLPKPYSWPYYKLGESAAYPSGDRFGDMWGIHERMNHFGRDFFGPAYGMPFPYPAPVALLYRIFYPTFERAIFAFEVLLAVVTLTAIALLSRRLITLRVSAPHAIGFALICGCFSGVMANEAQRTNMEIFALLTIAASIYFFLKRQYVLCALLIGIASSFKIYPLILLGLLFSRRRHREIVYALVTAAVAYFLSLRIITPIPIYPAFRLNLAGINANVDAMVKKINIAIGWDHSLFALSKMATLGMSPDIAHLLRFYTPIIFLGALALYFIRIRKLPAFNQIAVLVSLSIYITPNSYEYTLLQLYPVFGMFCVLTLQPDTVANNPKLLYVMSICFAWLFSVEGFFIANGIVFAGQVKAVVLGLLIYLFLRFPLPHAAWDDAQLA